MLILLAVLGWMGVTPIGCQSEVKTQKQEKVSSPGGTTTTTDTHTIESSGDHPPANSQGEAAK
jgi:hypothetical protein